MAWIRNRQVETREGLFGQRIVVAAMALVLYVCAPIASAQNAQAIDEADEPLVIEVGHSVVVSPPWPVGRVAVIRPDVADVQVLSPRQVLVFGTSVGATDVIIWDEEDEQVWRRRVEVYIDLAFIQQEIDRMFPTANLELVQSGTAVVVRGNLRRIEEAERLRTFLDSHGVNYVDFSSVAGVQQVLLQVKVAEVSRTALRTLGFNFFHTSDHFIGANVVGTSAGPLNPVSIGVPSGAPAASGLPFEFLSPTMVGPAVTMFGALPRADLQVFIQALAENQYLRILAEPNLVALSGEEASFLAGGEFPIPVIQAGAVAGAISIEYREFGVRLSFRPVVLGDNTIRLHVAPEVSDLTEIGAVVIEGLQIPGILTRRAETTLELKSGQTFAMAGLLNSRTDARNSRVPVLGDLPVIGTLFRSVRYTRGETELAVLVTATLVEPLSGDPASMPLPGVHHLEPNDWELYAEGMLQGRGPAQIAPADAEYLRERGLHRLQGPGAWTSYSSPAVEPAPHARPRPGGLDPAASPGPGTRPTRGRIAS